LKKSNNNTNSTKVKFHPVKSQSIGFSNDSDGAKEVSDDERKVDVDGDS